MKDWRLLTAKLCAENVYMYVEVMEEYGNDKKRLIRNGVYNFAAAYQSVHIISQIRFIKSAGLPEGDCLDKRPGDTFLNTPCQCTLPLLCNSGVITYDIPGF